MDPYAVFSQACHQAPCPRKGDIKPAGTPCSLTQLPLQSIYEKSAAITSDNSLPKMGMTTNEKTKKFTHFT